MKRYTFEVVIHEGSDEFWESNPSDHDVRHMLIDALEAYGLEIKREDGTRQYSEDTVELIRLERL